MPIGAIPSAPVGAVPGTPAAAAAAPAAPARANDQLDQDAFLKLLVAQLRYQDPSSPMDTSQFMAQTAQFTSVEKLTAIAQGQSALTASQGFLQAAAVVGRTVSWTGPDGQVLSGVVTAARFDAGAPVLKVGDTDVPIASVTQIAAVTAPSSPDPTTTQE